MDLATKAQNMPVSEMLSSLADETGDDRYDLAVDLIRRYQECIREHRLVIDSLLRRQGVHHWKITPGSTPRVPVSL